MRPSSLVLLLLATGVGADDWSFKDFLAGDWDLERHSDRGVDHAHYSLHAEGNMLEGSYYEDVDGMRRNEMVVKVTFDAGASGQFQLAKVQHVFENEDGTPPEPQPQKEPTTVFEFDFNAQSDSRFHLSTSSWLSKPQETVQFLTVDDDAFVFTKTSSKCAVKWQSESEASCTIGMESSSWTATRKGAPRGRAEPKRSLLQRYGWYTFFAILYCGYQFAKGKAAETMAGMQGKKTK